MVNRRLLEAVLNKTKTKRQQARAETLLNAFEYCEASTISYLGLVRHFQLPGKDRKYFEDMSEMRCKLVDEFEKDPHSRASTTV